MTRLIPTCNYCGSHKIVTDACAEWNQESQAWQLASKDSAAPAFCNDCGGETSFTMQPVQED